MLRNLPDHFKGKKIPLTVRLEKGMCVELQYNGGIVRRGIVHDDPAVSLKYMWWHPMTRFRSGQIPVCTTLEHNIPQERLDEITIEPVECFDTWLEQVPLSMKRFFGWTSTPRLRPSRAGNLPRKIRCDKGLPKGPRKVRADKGKKHRSPRKSRSDKGVKKKRLIRT